MHPNQRSKEDRGGGGRLLTGMRAAVGGGQAWGGWTAPLGEPEICKAREGGVCSFIILALLFLETDTCQKAKKA